MNQDPGLQPERTYLAWQRTALATAGIGLLAARIGFTCRSTLLEIAGGASCAIALVLFVLARRRRSSETVAPDSRQMLLSAFLAAAIALSVVGTMVGRMVDETAQRAERVSTFQARWCD
jgi:uncharacterized membrane protein YidH (DUF202 family)